MPAIVPLTGTLTVKPVVASAVANGCPVVAVLADGVTVQFVGEVPIAFANVTATDVVALILHVPARIGMPDSFVHVSDPINAFVEENCTNCGGLTLLLRHVAKELKLDPLPVQVR